jgi:zinc D-Ala-D-Ala carboxypeptidase
MKLTPHFTLEEFEFSEMAIRFRIPNHANHMHLKNLKALCVHTLEPIRERIEKPVNVRPTPGNP